MYEITKKDVVRLARGEMPYVLQGKPYIIMRQRVHVRSVDDNGSWEYLIVRSTDPEDDVDIDRETAYEIIRNQRLELALSMKEGQIYDTPDRSFQKKYKYTSKATA